MIILQCTKEREMVSTQTPLKNRVMNLEVNSHKKLFLIQWLEISRGTPLKYGEQRAKREVKKCKVSHCPFDFLLLS